MMLHLDENALVYLLSFVCDPEDYCNMACTCSAAHRIIVEHWAYLCPPAAVYQDRFVKQLTNSGLLHPMSNRAFDIKVELEKEDVVPRSLPHSFSSQTQYLQAGRSTLILPLQAAPHAIHGILLQGNQLLGEITIILTAGGGCIFEANQEWMPYLLNNNGDLELMRFVKHLPAPKWHDLEIFTSVDINVVVTSALLDTADKNVVWDFFSANQPSNEWNVTLFRSIKTTCSSSTDDTLQCRLLTELWDDYRLSIRATHLLFWDARCVEHFTLILNDTIKLRVEGWACKCFTEFDRKPYYKIPFLNQVDFSRIGDNKILLVKYENAITHAPPQVCVQYSTRLHHSMGMISNYQPSSF